MSSAIIFNGDYLKALKPKLKLSDAAYIETGSADPTSLSLTSPTGSLYLRSNGILYIKYDSAASAWAPALTTGTGGTLTSTELQDSSVYFVDEIDPSKKLYFQLSGIDNNTSITLTIPNTSGTIPLGTSTTGYVTYWSATNTLTGEAQLSSTRGGTGVNNAGTLTYGTNNITFTTSGITTLTLPTTGTLATLAGVENLSNKTINDSSIGSTTASSGAFTFLTVKGTGSAGTSYVDLLNESSAPTSPATGYTRLYATADVLNLKNASDEVFAVDYSAITASRTLSAPDISSTIATLDGNQTFTGVLSLSTANIVALAITGGLKVGNITSSAVAAGSGAIKYTSGFLYYSDGTNWNTIAQYANSLYQSSSFTASNNVNYFVDTTSGAVTATLPSGAANARIKFLDVKEKWGLNNFTITPASGQKIDNLATDESLIMDINGSWIELAWDSTSSSWVITGSLSYGTTPYGFVTHTGNSLASDLLIGTNDNYALAFETNGLERMRISNTGFVGINTLSPQAPLDLSGGFKGSYDSYAVNANLNKYHHFVVATAAITLNLPTLTSNDAGFTLYIKRVTAAGIVTINPGVGVTIDGASSWPLTSNYESVKLVWRGSTDWSIF
jgi:hypothetical protein